MLFRFLSLSFLIIVSVVGVIDFFDMKIFNTQSIQSPQNYMPSMIQKGEWKDDFLGGKLSVVTRTTTYGGYLHLKLDDYLNWTETHTEHFSPGQFFSN